MTRRGETAPPAASPLSLVVRSMLYASPMTDTDRERMEQLAEVIGECLAAIAALREDLAGVAAALR